MNLVAIRGDCAMPGGQHNARGNDRAGAPDTSIKEHCFFVPDCRASIDDTRLIDLSRVLKKISLCSAASHHDDCKRA